VKSRHYSYGIKGLRKLAETLGVTLDQPNLVGQDWWITVTLADGYEFTGDVREVNAFLLGIQHKESPSDATT